MELQGENQRMSIAESQVINKVLSDKDYAIISQNDLEDSNFVRYSKEFQYIKSFWAEYNCVPDKETFIAKFPEFKFYKVDESLSSIIYRLKEEKTFREGVAVFNKASEIFSVDANKGVEYALSAFKSLDTYQYFTCKGYNSTAQERLQVWKDKRDNIEDKYIPMPQELNQIFEDTHGFRRGSDLWLILAKSGVGKSQFLSVFGAECVNRGYTTGIISPEMNSFDFAVRVDTFNGKFSNRAIEDGDMVVGYEEYLNKISNSPDKLFFADMKDFHGKITMQKIKTFCNLKKLQCLFIDGLIYVQPEYYHKGMTETEREGQVAQELLTLSTEMGIPIITAIQARRRSNEHHNEDILSDTESIYGSYLVGQVATRVLSINKNKESNAITLYLSKNRYGVDNRTYIYLYDYDRLTFNYVHTLDEIKVTTELKEQAENFKSNVKNLF